MLRRQPSIFEISKEDVQTVKNASKMMCIEENETFEQLLAKTKSKSVKERIGIVSNK